MFRNRLRSKEAIDPPDETLQDPIDCLDAKGYFAMILAAISLVLPYVIALILVVGALLVVWRMLVGV